MNQNLFTTQDTQVPSTIQAFLDSDEVKKSGKIILQDNLGIPEWVNDGNGRSIPDYTNAKWQREIDVKDIVICHGVNAAGPYSKMVYCDRGINRVVTLREVQQNDGEQQSLTGHVLFVDEKWMN